MRLRTLVIASLVATGFLPLHSQAATPPPITSTNHFEGDTKGPYTSIYLDEFMPSKVVRFNISNDSYIIPESTTASANATINGTSLSFTLPAVFNLSDLNKAYVTYHSGSDNRDYWIFLSPPKLRPYDYSGDTTAIDSKTLLYTPGSFVVAQKKNQILYFSRTPNSAYGFQKLRATAHVNGGEATYAYLVKNDDSRKVTEPGFWIYLDSHYNIIDSTTVFSVGGVRMQPEGHDITVSQSGNPVVMTYFPRTVDSSWLAKPYPGLVFDCGISEIDKKSKAINSFSAWDYVSANTKVWKPILDKSETAIDTSTGYTATDWCHINSLEYDAATSQYIVSFRSLDRIFILSKDLKKVNAILYQPDARQHYARMINPTTITALGNYTSGSASNLLTWTLKKGKWSLKKEILPLHMLYCGNINRLSSTTYFVGGGCGTATPGTLGYVISTATTPWSLIGSLTSSGVPPYRIELTN